ncbi:MAG: hypothetical protein ACYC7J_09875 [Syntrophales bacterium]
MGIIGKFKELFFGARAEPGDNGLRYSERDVQATQMCAEGALRVFTESLNIANNSKNIKTRESRLRVARDALVELRKMERQFPFLHLENLQAVEASIAGVEAETRELANVQSASSPTSKTVGQLQNEPLSAWGNDDIITGLKFSATMQLRTPLRVLLRHGEIHTDRRKPPPKIADEGWEGVWVPKTKTYRELGLDIDEPPEGTHASAAGQVKPSEYLPFLVAVRRIVELSEPIENRIEKLRAMPVQGEWKVFVESHGGIETIIGRFFPDFIDTIPKIPVAARDELSEFGLNTPNRIAAATDKTLLGIKGIGLAKLKAIRDYCASITDKRDADRIENVIR